MSERNEAEKLKKEWNILSILYEDTVNKASIRKSRIFYHVSCPAKSETESTINELNVWRKKNEAENLKNDDDDELMLNVLRCHETY